MATRLYDIAINEENFDVSESAGSAITDDMAVTIDLATLDTYDGRLEVVKMIERFKQYLLEDTWPPA